MASPIKRKTTQAPPVGRPATSTSKAPAPTGYGKRRVAQGRPGTPAASSAAARGGAKKGKRIGQGGLTVTQSYAGGVSAAPSGRDTSQTPEVVLGQVMAPSPTPAALPTSGGIIAGLTGGGSTSGGRPSLTQPKIPKQL